MTIALHMYADDQNDWMAPPGWDGGGMFGGRIVPGWLYTSTNGSPPDPGPGGAYENSKNAAYATGLWFQYMPNPKAYLCPVDTRSRTYITKGLRNNRLSSYVMNGAVCGYGIQPTKYWACKIINVWSPMCYLQWEPDENYIVGNPPGFEFNDSSNYPDDHEGIGHLHSHKGGCIVAVGGHVEFITREQFLSQSKLTGVQAPGPGGKNYLFWSPYSPDGR
jgi:hypothetical protein